MRKQELKERNLSALLCAKWWNNCSCLKAVHAVRELCGLMEVSFRALSLERLSTGHALHMHKKKQSVRRVWLTVHVYAVTSMLWIQTVLCKWWCCKGQVLTGRDFLILCLEWESELPNPFSFHWLNIEHHQINSWKYMYYRGLSQKITTAGIQLIFNRSSATPHQ